MHLLTLRAKQGAKTRARPAQHLLLSSLLAMSVTSGAYAQVVVAPVNPQIGTAQPATAAPRIVRPQSSPCIVDLFTNQKFADFDDKPFAFAAPSDCPGPWRKVVFTSDFTVTAGRQFDRTAKFSVGGAVVYFGTTAEPRSTLSPSWHVERDVTDLSAVLRTATGGKASLGNFVGVDGGTTYDGVIYANAALEFYPASFAEPAPRVPDIVIALPGEGNSYSLATTDSRLEQTVTLPMNVEKAYLDVIAESQGNDEFWWTCVPSDVSDVLQSCGGTAFRETQVQLDRVAAGVAPIYPWIYTGGVSPSLWTPLPGVQTFRFEPYRVDLTPFAARLSDGQPHTVGLSVFNAADHFDGTANLLIYLDPFAARVGGAVLENTLSAAPVPNVTESLTTAGDGTVSGNVLVDASRDYLLRGFVTTSHGRVDTTIHGRIGFLNSQDFTITDTLYSQHIAQATDVHLETATASAWVSEIETQDFSYPLSFVYDYTSGTDYTISSYQKLLTNDQRSRAGRVLFATSVADEVSSQAGNPGRSSVATFTSKDSLLGCTGRTIRSAGGLVIAVEDGTGCSDDTGQLQKPSAGQFR